MRSKARSQRRTQRGLFQLRCLDSLNCNNLHESTCRTHVQLILMRHCAGLLTIDKFQAAHKCKRTMLVGHRLRQNMASLQAEDEEPSPSPASPSRLEIVEKVRVKELDLLKV